jgi:hypothetical protein
MLTLQRLTTYKDVAQWFLQKLKSPVKNFGRQRCAKGFNSGVKGLIHETCVFSPLNQFYNDVSSVYSRPWTLPLYTNGTNINLFQTDKLILWSNAVQDKNIENLVDLMFLICLLQLPIRPVFREVPLFIACDFMTRRTGLVEVCIYICHLDGESQESNLFIMVRHEYQTCFRVACL